MLAFTYHAWLKWSGLCINIYIYIFQCLFNELLLLHFPQNLMNFIDSSPGCEVHLHPKSAWLTPIRKSPRNYEYHGNSRGPTQTTSNYSSKLGCRPSCWHQKDPKSWSSCVLLLPVYNCMILFCFLYGWKRHRLSARSVWANKPEAGRFRLWMAAKSQPDLMVYHIAE